MEDCGHGELPEMSVKRDIMCISRRGMLHCSVAVTSAGAASEKAVGAGMAAIDDTKKGIETAAKGRNIILLVLRVDSQYQQQVGKEV